MPGPVDRHKVKVTTRRDKDGTQYVAFDGREFVYLSEAWMLNIPNCTEDRPCFECTAGQRQ